MADKDSESGEILSLDSVRDFLLRNNGKVKQADLVNHFRAELSSPSTKLRARQDFRNILQLLTAVKTENGEKFIILTKAAQDNFRTGAINRRASRPLSMRKELCKSKSEYLLGQLSGKIFEPIDDEEASMQGSISTISSQESADSGIGVETSSFQSVTSLRNALSVKMRDSKSSDSLCTTSTDNSEDLEDEIGLNDCLEVLPEEKEWFLASSHGKIDLLKKLLEEYPKLVKNRDFILGYTALHWAAKLGRADIVKLVINNGVDVQSKSHGGYTPLHVAAMSGKDQIITQLIELHGANIHARDHSGKKPKDLVKETVSADVQRKLGRSVVIKPDWVSSDYNTIIKGALHSHFHGNRFAAH